MIGARTPSRRIKLFGSGNRVPTRMVTLTNLIANGDFSNGTAGWTSNYSSTIVNESGRLAITVGVQWGYRAQSIATVVGHKYYYRGTVEGTTHNLFGIMGAGTQNVSLSSDGTQSLSGIATATATTHIIGAGDDRTSGWTKYWIDNVMFVDLTAYFGAGNEPSAAVIDDALNRFSNSWFSGSKIVTM